MIRGLKRKNRPSNFDSWSRSVALGAVEKTMEWRRRSDQEGEEKAGNS